MEYSLTIYIDFDHTLLDTEAYKRGLARSLTPLGISVKQFFAAYNTLRTHSSFSIPKIVATLVSNKARRKRAFQLLKKTAGQSVRSLLYADAIPFLHAMKSRGAKLILFTYGDPAFQKYKIAHIPQAKRLFDRVVITASASKQVTLPQFKRPAVIIDNREDVVRHFVRRFGWMPVLLIRGKQATRKRVVNTIPVCTSLVQVKNLIERMMPFVIG